MSYTVSLDGSSAALLSSSGASLPGPAASDAAAGGLHCP